MILDNHNMLIMMFSNQHFNMMRLFLVHKLSIVNRDPDEIKAIYIQYADKPRSVLLRRRWMSITGTYGNGKKARSYVLKLLRA